MKNNIELTNSAIAAHIIKIFNNILDDDQGKLDQYEFTTYKLLDIYDIFINGHLMAHFLSNNVFNLFKRLMEPVGKILPAEEVIKKILSLIKIYNHMDMKVSKVHENKNFQKFIDRIIKEIGEEKLKLYYSSTELEFSNDFGIKTKKPRQVGKNDLLESNIGKILTFYIKYCPYNKLVSQAESIKKDWILLIKK